MTEAARAKAGRGNQRRRKVVSNDDDRRNKRRSVRLSSQRGQSEGGEQSRASPHGRPAQEQAQGAKAKVKRARSANNKSPFFVSSPTTPASAPRLASPKQSIQRRNNRRRKNVSCIPFPPLSSPTFGLAQERLRQNPFQLLLACVFLTKTRGAVSMPVFFNLVTLYPTPTDLARAPLENVVAIFQHLGLQNQRAKRVIEMAQAWVRSPPAKNKRYRVLNYPRPGDGRDVKPFRASRVGIKECVDEKEATDDAAAGCIADDDERVAWEIGHIPGCGAYALDSWRIFCRDTLRGTESCDDACDSEQVCPSGTALTHIATGEWTRVVPLDKELRAFLKWRWLRHGRSWDSITGTTRAASNSEVLEAGRGGVMVDVDGEYSETIHALPSPAFRNEE